MEVVDEYEYLDTTQRCSGTAVALTFFRRYKRSGKRFCACRYVKSSMCSEKTQHLWYKHYEFFVRMYITSQQSYLLHN